MFGRLSTAFVYAPLVLAVLTAARPWGIPTPPASQCNTGTIQCCNSVQSAGSPDVINQLGLVGIVVEDVGALVGFDCSISVLGGNSCRAEPVCCTGNNYSGLIVIGCSPINMGL